MLSYTIRSKTNSRNKTIKYNKTNTEKIRRKHPKSPESYCCLRNTWVIAALRYSLMAQGCAKSRLKILTECTKQKTRNLPRHLLKIYWRFAEDTRRKLYRGLKIPNVTFNYNSFFPYSGLNLINSHTSPTNTCIYYYNYLQVFVLIRSPISA